MSDLYRVIVSRDVRSEYMFSARDEDHARRKARHGNQTPTVRVKCGSKILYVKKIKRRKDGRSKVLSFFMSSFGGGRRTPAAGAMRDD